MIVADLYVSDGIIYLFTVNCYRSSTNFYCSDFLPTVSGIPPSTPKGKSRTGLIIGIAVPVGVVSLILIFAICFWKRKSSSSNEEGKSIVVSFTESLGTSSFPSHFSVYWPGTFFVIWGRKILTICSSCTLFSDKIWYFLCDKCNLPWFIRS